MLNLATYQQEKFYLSMHTFQENNRLNSDPSLKFRFNKAQAAYGIIQYEIRY